MCRCQVECLLQVRPWFQQADVYLLSARYVSEVEASAERGITGTGGGAASGRCLSLITAYACIRSRTPAIHPNLLNHPKPIPLHWNRALHQVDLAFWRVSALASDGTVIGKGRESMGFHRPVAWALLVPRFHGAVEPTRAGPRAAEQVLTVVLGGAAGGPGVLP
jgi:hypothetical protein